ncbi:5-deoxy-glucuronate isomerase [Mesorhizobium sp. B283B1A]|uniref:5-deoxy-glucuronate isomerase n=1 Tax=Mesorhizobium TaxID=68287 RepID=UPI001CD15E5C|nr:MULTISPECIES: 5-deoxy-glucuronate isomerase [Mesorhizobium]MCA0050372.1 5-deoxy-glucuronate isomerase [Mesorhizobium sp. B283B1A]UQS65234.1 5-deoxy-glucuronate isomerase [Mesorhizobium opportunistum]
MSKLLVKADKGHGRVAHVTPESAGWTYVGFDLHRLKPGETASGKTDDREICLVFVTGKGKAKAGGKDLGLLGQRMSPFEGKPWSVYVPQGSDWSVTAGTELELAVCSAPGLGGGLPVRVIGPNDLGQEVRGKATNTRYVTNILPEGQPADSLLVVEVITPGGHTSSYPPHKHDRDNLPAESYLEETYYHRLNPPQGFAFQRVYTDADKTGHRALDEAMAIEDGDVVLVPEGYHPCAACHGYDLYYLNVMAGPKRTWKFHNAPEHEWLMRA